MNGLYLVDMAAWLRDAGLVVVEWSGWQTRARGSGGFIGNRPWCVMWHHTASVADPDDDAAYIATGSPDAPISNLLIARDGTVYVIAAGASNTNGKGYAMSFSRGRVPDDEMNTHAVSMEIANAGTGEPYPSRQIDSCFHASMTLTDRLGLFVDDVGQHWDWAPDRKIDPATADAVMGGWHPNQVNGSGTWALADLRAELARRSGTTPTPPLPPTPTPVEDDNVLVVALDTNGTAWIGDGINRFALDDPAVFDRYVLVWAGRFVNTSGHPVHGWPDVAEVDDLVITSLGRA